MNTKWKFTTYDCKTHITLNTWITISTTECVLHAVKDWTGKDKDKDIDQAYKDQDKNKD